jgi:hypothetical protein
MNICSTCSAYTIRILATYTVLDSPRGNEGSGHDTGHLVQLIASNLFFFFCHHRVGARQEYGFQSSARGAALHSGSPVVGPRPITAISALETGPQAAQHHANAVPGRGHHGARRGITIGVPFFASLSVLP